MTLRPSGGVRVARIWGMEIRIHLVWVLILAVITVVASTEAGDIHPGMPSEIRWLVGLLAAFSFLGSVLVHELAHAFAARRRGLPVGPITLLFFGGGSSVDQAVGRPQDEAWVAAAGPLTSLGLGLVLVGVGVLAPEPRLAWAQAAFLLGVLNATLGVLHLTPAYPLDGGRVLRAVVWARTGDERRGSHAAVLVGRATGYVLIGIGLAVSLFGDPLNSVMLVVSGWFLGSAARGLDRRAAIEDLLQGLRVDEVMERDTPSVSPQLTLDTFASQYLERPDASSLAVMRGDALLGLIGVSELRRIARRRWPTTRAEQIMVAAPALPMLAPELPMRSGLDELRRTGLDGLPVSRGAELLGVLTRRSVVAAIQRRAGEQGRGLGGRRGPLHKGPAGEGSSGRPGEPPDAPEPPDSPDLSEPRL